MSNEINDDDLILVTGASGFIATHIVKQLLEKGYRVRGTVRSTKDEKKCAPLRNLVENARFPLELVEADLLNEDTWISAVKDCTYVLHTASPVPSKEPNHEDEIIKPAVNGTLSVLRACAQEGSKVKRVVFTSSMAAIAGDSYIPEHTYSEKDWSDPYKLLPYYKSKTLAEKAAWDFIKSRQEENLPCFELSVINPGMCLGPVLHNSDSASMELIRALMINKMPMVPDVSICACDVRDVAEAHIKAMTVAEAKNNRHLITGPREALSFLEVARILSEEFVPKNYKIPTTRAPNFVIKMASYFDSTLTQLTGILSVKTYYDNSRLVNVLGIKPRDMKTTILDGAYSLIERNIVPKKF